MAGKYDLIVVGAGPGGAATAKTAADLGLKVIMFERARTPGDKNMSGSVFFRPIVEEIFPGFSDAEFLKPHATLSGIGVRWALDNDELEYGITAAPGNDVMDDMCTLWRNESDEWCAEYAVKAGVELKTALIDDVIWENPGTDDARVVGVLDATGEQYEAPFIVAADGFHSNLARKTGLANFGQDKMQLAMKYIFQMDKDVMARRYDVYQNASGKYVYDWGDDPVLFGENPAIFACHAVAAPGKGIVEVTTYMPMTTMIQQRVNIHQRMQWFVNTPRQRRNLEGAKLIQMNFHCLGCFEEVGYAKKTYLPGLVLVGDSGGFTHPMDSWGANTAQWLGRMAANLCLEMKQKNDYSEAMFKKYEDTWRDSWIGLDELTTEQARPFRNGQFNALWWAIHNVASTCIPLKFQNKSYGEVFAAIPGALAPSIPELAGPMLKGSLKFGASKLGPLLGMLGAMKGE